MKKKDEGKNHIKYICNAWHWFFPTIVGDLIQTLTMSSSNNSKERKKKYTFTRCMTSYFSLCGESEAKKYDSIRQKQWKKKKNNRTTKEKEKYFIFADKNLSPDEVRRFSYRWIILIIKTYLYWVWFILPRMSYIR